MTTVTVKREFVPLTPQEVADHKAAIVAILQKYLPLCITPERSLPLGLTPAPIPVKLEVKATTGEGER